MERKLYEPIKNEIEEKKKREKVIDLRIEAVPLESKTLYLYIFYAGYFAGKFGHFFGHCSYKKKVFYCLIILVLVKNPFR